MRAKLLLAARTTSAASLAALVTIAWSQLCAAQTPEQNQAAPTALEEVVVTATRRATTVQSTPLSIDALSSETLEQTVAKNVNDFILSVPSLSAADNGPGNKRYAIRN